MALLKKIVTGDRRRLAQLIPGVGNNQQARASDVNTVIDAVNSILQAEDIRTTPTSINVTGTATPLQVASGWITSTSAAAVTITLPSVSLIAQALNITPVTGSTFEFVIDNSAGANTVTVAIDSGATIAVTTPVITGGATLTVSTANVYGGFKLIFNSPTTAKLLRIF